MNQRLKILDIWVDPVNGAEALQRAAGYIEHGTRPYSVFASNPEKNFTVPRDPYLHAIYRQADLLLPDGIGVVAAARFLYGVKLSRVPGSEFIFQLCDLAQGKGYGVFFFGAREDVSRLAIEKLKLCYPRLIIAGRRHGYVSGPETAGLIDEINASGARILFLALGSPKQEKWFAAHKDRLQHVRVCQAIGGTLDTVAGTVRRAPRRWCQMNLEWLYRLLSEPRRIKRQRVLPLFAFLVASSWLGKVMRPARLNGIGRCFLA